MSDVQKLVGLGLDVGKAVTAAVAAKTTVGKVMALLPILEDVPSLIGVDYAALKSEVSQMSPADLDALKVYIDANFSIPDADKQAKIDGAVSVVIDLAKVLEQAVAMWK